MGLGQRNGGLRLGEEHRSKLPLILVPLCPIRHSLCLPNDLPLGEEVRVLSALTPRHGSQVASPSFPCS